MPKWIPQRGELVDVSWVDIVEDPRGHPGRLRLSLFTHTYRFYEERTETHGGKDFKVIALTNSKHVTDDPESSYHAVVIPKSCIVKIEKAT